MGDAVSDDDYATLLRYHNGIGVAKLHGTAVTISIPPDLGSGPAHRVEYRPEIGERQVAMSNDDPMRRMTDEETRAANQLLARAVARNGDACRYDEPWKEGRC